MLEKGSYVALYPYNIELLSEDAKLQIPAFYRHGKGSMVQFWVEGTVIDDDGTEFTMRRKDNNTKLTSQWDDIYKVVVKLDASGKQPLFSGRVIYAPGRIQPDVSSELEDPYFAGGSRDTSFDASEDTAFYGGGKATDEKAKEGSYTYVLIGACLVGIAIYMS